MKQSTRSKNMAIEVEELPELLVVELPETVWKEIRPGRSREDTAIDEKLMSGKTHFIEGAVTKLYQRADLRGYKQKAHKYTFKDKAGKEHTGSIVRWEKKETKES
jgi:hypothetical protein